MFRRNVWSCSIRASVDADVVADWLPFDAPSVSHCDAPRGRFFDFDGDDEVGGLDMAQFIHRRRS